MTTSKVALTIPADALRLARKEVRAGHARSLSAFVSAAVVEKLRRDELAGLLDAMDAEHGAPSPAARRERASVVTSDLADLRRLDPTLRIARI